jgi:hypothetical protein
MPNVKSESDAAVLIKRMKTTGLSLIKKALLQRAFIVDWP